MFLLILDKNPYKAAELIPDRLKFKQLLELCQLICSAGISNVYKKVNQGKKLQEWVKNNIEWIEKYYRTLYKWCFININFKENTDFNLIKIWKNLLNFPESWKINYEPQTAIFRYVKEYAGMTSYESNSELPIDVAISEYKRYLEYKEKQFNEKQANKRKVAKNN